MDIIWIFILMALVTLGAIVLVDIYNRWQSEVLDEEYRQVEKEKKSSICPICMQSMDLSKTQRVINTANGTEICCIYHANKDVVDYIIKVNRRAIKDDKKVH